MGHDPIRELLARIATGAMGLPPDHSAAPFGHVEANGADLDTVSKWVEAHDGWVDRPQRVPQSGLRAGRRVEPVTRGDRRRFVVPAAALEITD